MSFELAIATHEYDVRVVGVLEQIAKVLAESTLGYFESIERRLPAYVHRVDDHADLGVECELVVGQQTVRFVEKKIAPYELFEAPVFALHKLVRSLTLFLNPTNSNNY